MKKDLALEYDLKFEEWLKHQSALSRVTDQLLSTNSRLEKQNNDEIYSRMNPFHLCGSLGLRFMEETFGYITNRTFFYRKEERRYVHDNQQSDPSNQDDDDRNQAS